MTNDVSSVAFTQVARLAKPRSIASAVQAIEKVVVLPQRTQTNCTMKNRFRHEQGAHF